MLPAEPLQPLQRVRGVCTVAWGGVSCPWDCLVENSPFIILLKKKKELRLS